MKKVFLKRNYPKGITLPEILIYIAVLSIIVVVILSFIIWVVNSNNKTKAMRTVLDQAARAMDVMTQEVRGAKSVYAPTSTSGQLSLETTKYLPQGENASYVDFFLCGKRLCMKKETDAIPVALTADNVEVNNLNFTRIVSGGKPSVKIELTVDFLNTANRPEYQATINLTSSVSLRSY